MYKGTDPSNIVFDVVDYAAVTQEILAALYTPFPYGEVLAQALLLLEAAAAVGRLSPVLLQRCLCRLAGAQSNLPTCLRNFLL